MPSTTFLGDDEYVVVESDRNASGVGDTIFKTGGVERARIKADGTATGLLSSSRTFKYVLVSDGTTVTAYDKTGAVVSSGTDGGAVFAAVLPTASSAGAAITFRNDGNAFPWGSVPALPKGITNKLVIVGNGALIQLSVAGPRFLDFNKTADYDTFQNISVEDFVIDGGGVTGAHHVVIGNLTAAGWSLRLNFANITVRKIRTVNVASGTNAGGTDNVQNVSIVSKHAASSEGTQTTITDVLVEDCNFTGGNVGVAVMGAGTSVTAGLGVNVLIDRVSVNRLTWDRGVVPASFTPDAAVQIGGYAQCGRVRLTDCNGSNSHDTTYEMDNVQDLVMRGCTATDPWNESFLFGNFRAPLDVNTQKNTFRDCTSRRVAFDRALNYSTDFQLYGNSGFASRNFGEAAIIDCRCEDVITTMPTGVNFPNLAIDDIANQLNFRKLTIRNLKISYSNLVVTAGGGLPILCSTRSIRPGAIYDVDGIDFTLAGPRTNAGLNTWTLTRWDSANGANTECSLRRITVDGVGLTGMTLATDVFHLCAIGTIAGGMKVKVERFAATTAPTGGWHGVTVGGNLIPVGLVYINECDFVNLVAGSGLDYNISSALNAKVFVRSIVSQRTKASGSGPITAPVALTGLVTATGVAVGTTTIGKAAIVQFLQGSGAGVTAIDFSTNGGTTYTNLLTQAAAALPAGADLVLPPLAPDALVKVTFTTTQPTVTLVPVNP